MEISKENWKAFSLLFREQERALGVEIGPKEEEGLRMDLSSYLMDLLDWNERINLTSTRDFSEAVWKHLYDSLLFAHHVPRGTILDWGTGGGLPGVPIGLWRKYMLGEEAQIILLDSRKKKIKALEEFVEGRFPGMFGFSPMRGEDFLKEAKGVKGVFFRAVASLEAIKGFLSFKVSHWFFWVGPQGRREWKEEQNYFSSKGFRVLFSPERSLPQNLGKRSLVWLVRE